MASNFELILLLFVAVIAVLDVLAVEDISQTNKADHGGNIEGKQTMMRIDSGGLYPPGLGPEDLPQKLESWDTIKSRELGEKLRTMTTEERREFIRQRQEIRRAERRWKYDITHPDDDTNKLTERERRRWGFGVKPHKVSQGGGYLRKWQKKQHRQDKPTGVNPGVMATWQTNGGAAEAGSNRLKRAINEAPSSATTRSAEGRQRGHGKRRDGSRREDKKAAKKSQKRQYKQEKREGLQNTLDEMDIPIEEFKAMEKSERRLIKKVVKEQLPERQPGTEQKPKKEKKSKKERKGTKKQTGVKGLRRDPDFQQRLQAIKSDATLSREEKRTKMDELKTEFRAMSDGVIKQQYF